MTLISGSPTLRTVDLRFTETNRHIDDVKDVLRSEMYRVEQVLDARLKHLEEHLCLLLDADRHIHGHSLRRKTHTIIAGLIPQRTGLCRRAQIRRGRHFEFRHQFKRPGHH
jgi:hypothetical protein